jgi:hypothetical protein
MTSLHSRPNTALMVVDVRNNVVSSAYQREQGVATEDVGA